MKSVFRTLHTDVGDVSHAREEREYVDDLFCQRSGCIMYMGTSDLHGQRSGCILDGGPGSICKQILFHTFHKRNCPRFLEIIRKFNAVN